jgi:hypothetical protein
MTGGPVQRVDPEDLRNKANMMKNSPWKNPFTEPVAPPDQLPSTLAAIENLNTNARTLADFQEWGQAEKNRLADMLIGAADEYERVDREFGMNIEDPDRQAAVAAIANPEPGGPETPLPDESPPQKRVDASGYSPVPTTEEQFNAGAGTASLEAASDAFISNASFLENQAQDEMPPPGDWEGQAADAAFSRLSDFSSWVQRLARAWRQLGEGAETLAEAHRQNKEAHHEIFNQYQEKWTQFVGLLNKPGGLTAEQRRLLNDLQNQLQQLQEQSDKLRQTYALQETFNPVSPADPPGRHRGHGGGGPGSGGETGSGAGADRPLGDPEEMARRMAESLGEPQPTAAAPTGGGGGVPAGTGAGGAPAGGGVPAGAGAGMPTGVPAAVSPGGMPPLRDPSTNPGLRPAGGGGGGAGGGAGGGGIGSMPLAPPVAPETVAPGPVIPTPGAAAAAPAAGVGAPMMGGMAPMHGAGAQHGQGKEKKRDPRLAPDEELYKEDRPYTEPVVGQRPRRKEAPGGKEAT